MRAPKTPVSTSTPRSRSAAQKRSYRRSASPGSAAPPKLGRLPLAVSAISVNWLTARMPPPVSSTERSKRPSSFSKIRRRATFSASRDGLALRVTGRHTEQDEQSGVDLAGDDAVDPHGGPRNALDHGPHVDPHYGR